MLSNNKSNSIQAVGVISSNNHDKATRIFYLISFLFTTAAFFFYVYQSYAKWKIEPDIAVRRHSKYLEEIPFPALTICSPVFARWNILRYKDYSSIVTKANPKILENVSSTVANYLLSNEHACNPYFVHVGEKVKKFRTETDIVKLLNESFLEIDEVISDCIYGSKFTRCDGMFNRVLTDRGFCYTFNMQGFNTVFNADVISDDFQSYNRTNKIFKSPKFKFRNAGYVDDDNETVDWTLEAGYKEGHKTHFIPVNAMKGHSVAFYLALKKLNYENMCSVFTNSFNYYLHLPNEIPTNFHKRQFIRFHEKSFVTLTATVYKTSKDLRKLKPDARGCYFEGERQLKFFKSYTKSNCDLECMTNFTFKHIGCVKFSMPRNKTTKVCDVDKSKHYYSAMAVWPGYNLTTKKVIDSCNCLKTCNDIQYGIGQDDSSLTDLKNHPALIDNGVTEEDIFSYLHIKFDDNFVVEEESYAPYALQNSDTGGLLGLFIGCSILSIFEVCYYLTFKVANLCIKNDKSKNECNESVHNVIEVIPVYDLELKDFQKQQHEMKLQLQELKTLLKQRDKELASVLGQIYTQRH